MNEFAWVAARREHSIQGNGPIYGHFFPRVNQSHEEFVNVFAAETKLSPSWNYLGKLRTSPSVQ